MSCLVKIILEMISVESEVHFCLFAYSCFVLSYNQNHAVRSSLKCINIWRLRYVPHVSSLSFLEFDSAINNIFFIIIIIRDVIRDFIVLCWLTIFDFSCFFCRNKERKNLGKRYNFLLFILLFLFILIFY